MVSAVIAAGMEYRARTEEGVRGSFLQPVMPELRLGDHIGLGQSEKGKKGIWGEGNAGNKVIEV